MKQIHKEYARPFLLEETKLRRLLDRIHERLAEHDHTSPHDYFEVFLSGSRREEMSSVADVLALENSRRHRIQRLILTSTAASAGAARSEHQVQIDFASHAPSTSASGTTSTTTKITVSVASDAAGWAASTLSEIEEQVERTWSQDARGRTGLVAVAISAVALLFVVIALSSPRRPELAQDAVKTMWLRSPDLDRLEVMLKQKRTLGEEELREVLTRQLANVLAEQRPAPSARKWRIRSLLLIGVPLAVILSGALWLAATCYPSAVFLWGDEVEHYARMVNTRKTGWNIIVGSTIFGVLASLFAVGLASWIPPE